MEVDILKEQFKKWGTAFGILFLLMLYLAVSAFGNSLTYDDWRIVLENDSEGNDLDSVEAIRECEDEIYTQYLQSISDRENELKSGSITIGNTTMKVYMKRIGMPYEKGYPLFIALRGGGNDDDTVAAEQYELMKEYYTDTIRSGIYVVPHGVCSSWDEHYRPESFLFYDRIIEDAIAFYHVDPNRVYILGFSSGGDGVYAVSPRIPDRFAAVNMSAGCPHTKLIGNMYNLPICIQVGENDSDYDRNIYAGRDDLLLHKMADEYGGGFIHDTFIHAGGTHNENWSDTERDSQTVVSEDSIAKWIGNRLSAKYTEKNTCATDWCIHYVRDPLPSRVVWNTGSNAGLRDSQMYYWLDRDGLLQNETIVASYDRETNTVNIEQCSATKGTLKIYLKPEMLDVFQVIHVNVCGRLSVDVQPVISRQIMQNSLKARGDKNYIFTSEIDLIFDENDKSVKVEVVKENDPDYSVTERENLIFWDSEGLFFADQSLFGLTYEEVGAKLGIELQKPMEWHRDGKDLYCSIAKNLGEQSVFFLFQYGKCVIIYSEEPGKIRIALQKHAENIFGSSNWVLVDGGLCFYYLENKYHSNEYHARQSYVHYTYVQ